MKDEKSLALWYSSKSKLCWREGEKYFLQFRYPESASSFEESIEFATKAICEFWDEKYRRKHDISDALMSLSAKFPSHKELLTRAGWISSRWVGMAQRARVLVRYGNQEAKVSATRIVTKKDIAPIRVDATEVRDLLHKIEIKHKFNPPIRLGILNGHVDEYDSQEKPCEKYAFIDYRLDDWEKRFSQIVNGGKNRYDIKKIPMSRTSNEFAVIINPFGEVYPEGDPRKRLAFNILKDYIADGGVLVNTAGFPFFYAWDVNKGEAKPVIDTTVLVPQKIRVEEGKVVVDQFLALLNFAGSLFWREMPPVR